MSQSGRRGRGEGDDTLADFDMRKDMGMGMDTACSFSGGGEHTDAPLRGCAKCRQIPPDSERTLCLEESSLYLVSSIIVVRLPSVFRRNQNAQVAFHWKWSLDVDGEDDRDEASASSTRSSCASDMKGPGVQGCMLAWIWSGTCRNWKEGGR